MARSRKDRRKAPNRPEIDLLGAIFNLPTRRDIELAQRRLQAPQAQLQFRASHLGAEKHEGKNVDGNGDSSSESSSSSDSGSELIIDLTPENATASCEKKKKNKKNKNKNKKNKHRDARRSPSQSRISSHRQTQPASRQESKSRRKQNHSPVKQPASQKPQRKLTKSASSTNPAQAAQSIAPPVPYSASYPSFRDLKGIRPPSMQAGGSIAAQPQHQYLAQPPFPVATCIPVASPQVLRPPAAHGQPFTAFFAPQSHGAPPAGAQARQQQPAGIVAREIQKIQAEIDAKAAMLSHNAGDQALRNDLNALQMKLNSTLNAILGAKASNQTSPETPLKADEASQRSSSRVTREQISKDEPRRRGASPESAIRHHLCSGCGNVRSAKFHGKHPIAPGEKPVLNFCKSCQGDGEGDLQDLYHFCLRCGIVRSKEFQRKHPKTSVLPNYCGKCTLEIQSIVGIAQASTLDVDSHDSAEAEEPGTSSSLAVEVTPEMEYMTVRPGASGTDLSKMAVSDESLESSSAPPGTRKDNEPLNKARAFAEPHQASLDVPYLPDRVSGSSQRRAQPSQGRHQQTYSDKSYRAPYVEEAQSPVARQAECPPRAPEGAAAQRSMASEQAHARDTTADPSEESSGYLTEESIEERRPSKTKPRPNKSKKTTEPAQTSDQDPASEDAPRFWKGAFARREGGEPSAWSSRASPSSNPASSASSSPPPPPPHADESCFSGFPPGHPDEPPPLRTSKGAFGSSAFRNSFGESGFPGCAPFASHEPHGGQANSWGGSSYEGGKSVPAGMSSFAGFGSRFDPESFTMKEDVEFLNDLNSDYAPFGSAAGSGSGHHNPYYTPRTKPAFFTDAESSWSRRRPGPRGRQGWSGARAYAWRKPTPDWVPEPIIEEPASPPSSPIQRAMLLEFGNESAGSASPPLPPLSDASTDSSDADALSVSDMDGDHRCDHSDGDEDAAQRRMFCEL